MLKTTTYMKTYEVNIDMKWSVIKLVTAKTAAEAKRKAWKKFRPAKKNFELLADKVD
jgi:hypothetical protein